MHPSYNFLDEFTPHASDPDSFFFFFLVKVHNVYICMYTCLNSMNKINIY